MNPFPSMPKKLVPGDRAWLNGKPVTVLTVMGKRAHIIPGHHSWTGCVVEDLSLDAASAEPDDDERELTAWAVSMLTGLNRDELEELGGFA